MTVERTASILIIVMRWVVWLPATFLGLVALATIAGIVGRDSHWLLVASTVAVCVAIIQFVGVSLLALLHLWLCRRGSR